MILEDHPMESWRKVWREGLAPMLSNNALHVLRHALLADDPRLVQGVTTTPTPLPAAMALDVEAACALGYCGWQGEGLHTVGEVEEFFARMCFAIDQRTGEPAGCRWFLNWFDETPREQMRQELIAEVDRALAERYADDADMPEADDDTAAA